MADSFPVPMLRITIKLTLATLPLTCLLLLACNQASLTEDRFQSERSIAEETLRGTNNRACKNSSNTTVPNSKQGGGISKKEIFQSHPRNLAV